MDQKKERTAFPMWAILVGALPVAAVLFLTIFRTKFAGPEMSLFEGINICLLTYFLWNYKILAKKYGEARRAAVRVTVVIYTIAQFLTTILMMDKFFIYFYTAFQVLLIILLFFALQIILKEKQT